MITTRNNRLDPSQIPEEELDRLAGLFAKSGHVALIDDQGSRTHIPEALFRHFARIIRLMSEKKAVVMIPEDETFTTQAGADYLGMSRQHLVNLLEQGVIPFHKVGSHRRVTFKDLVAFEQNRDRSRRKALDDLTETIDQAGLYFPNEGDVDK